jgi:O-antigen chain-terminating methyltransferase
MKSAKEFLSKVPVVNRLALIAKQVYKLPDRIPEHELQLEKLGQHIEETIGILKGQQAELSQHISALAELQDNFRGQLALIDKQLRHKPQAAETADNQGKELFADDHLLDVFYTKFEDRFRGDEATIEGRLEEYLPLFKNAGIDFKKYPVLDIGSGRGELLSLLKSHEIKAVGLDINLDMVERANKKGLETKQGEALEFLEAEGAGKYGAITGFHIVEHIPFNQLLRIFASAHRALCANGFVVFETPNPENVLVATHNFYLDPSHLNPLPPALLAFALEISGFRKVEIKRMHADDEKHEKSPADIKKYFYGPRDYAVVGYK